MANEYRFPEPEISGEQELFACLHALDSAFDHMLRALNLLNERLVLRPESVQANSAAIQAIRAALHLELRQALGESGFGHFQELSKKVRHIGNTTDR